ncbi:MAG: M28 family peptidase [Gemmatimonadetes bacterium]|nr:M28 family peptidase [Gemmatimonadota bacterium]NNM03846.1 M28 family peptidase [Gemmatimonadota bacterium]
MKPNRLLAMLALSLPIWSSGCGDLLGSGGGGPGALEATVPAQGGNAVSVLSPVQLVFDKAVKLTSLSAAVSLWNGDRAVIVNPELAPDGRTIVLDPVDPLDFGTTYRVEVSELLRFKGGGTFANPTNWEFTTEGLSPPTPNRDSLFVNLEALSHDSMRGRGSGSADELRAAEYLRDRYLSYGLQEPPGGVIQSFQAFSNRQNRTLDSRNVLAAVQGSGALADEWIVVGAHFDHIGFRGLDDESQGPNNGADDNGSGTVLILEMARILQDYVDSGGMAARDRRSVLFAGFGAEEDGLLGSCAYVYENPAIPLSQTKAMMNFDMVGRLRNSTLYLSGGETSSVWAPLAANSNLVDLSAPLSTSSCTGCTDHVCFWREGVPFLGFFTGLHDEYHAPEDDVETINFPGMVEVGSVGIRALSRLMVMEEAPPLTGVYPLSQ